MAPGQPEPEAADLEAASALDREQIQALLLQFHPESRFTFGNEGGLRDLATRRRYPALKFHERSRLLDVQTVGNRLAGLDEARSGRQSRFGPVKLPIRHVSGQWVGLSQTFNNPPDRFRPYAGVIVRDHDDVTPAGTAALPRLDEGVVHADAEFALVLAAARQLRRNEGLVDIDAEFGHLARAELCSRDRDPLESRSRAAAP